MKRQEKEGEKASIRITWASTAVARAELACDGITVKSKVNGEYRVAKSGRGNEASAYYTNDLRDAIGTAYVMAHPVTVYCVECGVAVELDCICDDLNFDQYDNGGAR